MSDCADLPDNDSSIEENNVFSLKEFNVDVENLHISREDIQQLQNHYNIKQAGKNHSSDQVDDMQDDYHCYYCKEKFECEEELKVHKCEGTHTLIDEGNTILGEDVTK